MSFIKVFISLLILVFAVSLITAEYPPKNEEEIPIYPGAERDLAAEEEYQSQNEGLAEEERAESEIIKIYSVYAPPEKVCEFYIKSLNAKEGFPEEEPDLSKPGFVAPWYEMEFFEESDFVDQVERGDVIYSGKWVKSCLSQREFWNDGKWVSSTYFEWNIIYENGDIGQFSISVEDDSFDWYNKKFNEKTKIIINIKRN